MQLPLLMSSMTGLISLSSDRVLFDDKQDPSPGTIQVEPQTGLITAIWSYKIPDVDYDYGNLVIMPGLVDAHVHLNEPGRTDWEGFESGTKAAISGGVTTVVDMPLNAIPPTTTVGNLDIKLAAAAGQCYSDVAFWGGVIPNHSEHLKPLVNAGVRGFKCFLIESGVEEFPHVRPSDVTVAMEELKDTGSILMFHAEMDASESIGLGLAGNRNAKGYQAFLDSRPDSFEVDAIRQIVDIARDYPTLRLHIVHLASSEALPILREAQAAGLHITAETCFHYLSFQSDEIPETGTQYKCCPPIRSASNREMLWTALKEGSITSVVSDHSPCTPKLKEGSFMSAWGGVSALGLGLQILWTGASERNFSIKDVSRWTSRNTAIQTRLFPKKGSLTVGADADLVIWDPEAKWTIELDDLHFKNKVSPYIGKKVKGRVMETWLRGEKVWDQKSKWTQPRGQAILTSGR